MRGLAVAVLGLTLLLAVPAAARPQDETVTLRIGETKQLRTVFDKSEEVTLVFSGVITRKIEGSSLPPQSYDPFHGYTGNCQNAGPSVYLQIQDARGVGIDYAGAGQPPCRTDHRYEFTINDHPPGWDLDGKAKAYIPLLKPSANITTTGSFTLKIIGAGGPMRRDLRFKVAAKMELAASKKKHLFADVRLTGAGAVLDVDAREPNVGGRFSVVLVRLQGDDGRLVLRATRVLSRRLGLGPRVVLETKVTKSNEPQCPRNSTVNVALEAGAAESAVLYGSAGGGCPLPGYGFVWSEPKSEMAVNMRLVKG